MRITERTNRFVDFTKMIQLEKGYERNKEGYLGFTEVKFYKGGNENKIDRLKWDVRFIPAADQVFFELMVDNLVLMKYNCEWVRNEEEHPVISIPISHFPEWIFWYGMLELSREEGVTHIECKCKGVNWITSKEGVLKVNVEVKKE